MSSDRGLQITTPTLLSQSVGCQGDESVRDILWRKTTTAEHFQLSRNKHFDCIWIEAFQDSGNYRKKANHASYWLEKPCCLLSTSHLTRRGRRIFLFLSTIEQCHNKTSTLYHAGRGGGVCWLLAVSLDLFVLYCAHNRNKSSRNMREGTEWGRRGGFTERCR